MKLLVISSFFLIFQACSLSIEASEIQSSLTGLSTGYRENPLGIDTQRPAFSWKMEAGKNVYSLKQEAYRITVLNEENEKLWDSGKVKSSTSVHIQYNGPALKAQTRYSWKLSVWDNAGHILNAGSFFETGLMNPGTEAWHDAEWIGTPAEKRPLYGDYLPLYKIESEFRIMPRGQNGGIIFAANDPRLMAADKNIFGLENKMNGSYFKVELDVGPLTNRLNARLNIYRSGYTPDDDPLAPLISLPVKQSVINHQNRYDLHKLVIKSEFGLLTIALDNEPAFVETGSTDALPLTSMNPVQVLLNPLGNNHDFITYGMLADIGLFAGSNSAIELSKFAVHDLHAPGRKLYDLLSSPELTRKAESEPYSLYNEVIHLQSGTKGRMVTFDTAGYSMPRLRNEFTLPEQAISKARLYVTARGIYEFYVNGQRVSNDYFNPGLTQYNKTHFYQTYDVLPYLQHGGNAMGAQLAEGWWSGMLGYGNTWNGFGDQQSLLAQLIITYENGEQDVFVTSPDTWQFDATGPLQYASLNMGEVYDAGKENTDWSTTEFEETWENARVIALSSSQSREVQPNMADPAQTLNYDNLSLVGQIDEPVRTFKEFSPVSREEVRPGVFIYDLGQNIVGFPRISFNSEKEGKKITLRYAEMRYPDSAESGINAGMIMTENYRAALSQDIYITRNGKQIFEPRFTSHGFRYIEISGADSPPEMSDVTGVSVSSVQALTAGYHSSDENINKLWSNLVWSNVDNFVSVPTDCPQRNERMGWSGDINVFAPTAVYVSNASSFLERHLLAMRDTQRQDGRFADIAPVGGGFGGVLWGIAGITVAWETFMQYGNSSLLEEHYDSMAAYMAYLQENIDPETQLLTDALLGDWLGPQNWSLGSDYLATAYHIYALDLMARISGHLGRRGDKQRYIGQYRQRKAFFNERFINRNGDTLGITYAENAFNPYSRPTETTVANTHTSYAVALGLGILNAQNEKNIAEKLGAALKRPAPNDSGEMLPPYSLMTGFIGTAWISNALSSHGMADEAYKLILNEQYPSWLYPVNQGATTIWERLDGFTPEKGFGGNNNMNSFNHYSFGAVGEWMIKYSAGIRSDVPGFQHFTLAPDIPSDLAIDEVDAYYESMYGKIKSHWKIEENRFTYNIDIPANTSATVKLPAWLKHVSLIKHGDKTTPASHRLNLDSGRYILTADTKQSVPVN